MKNLLFLIFFFSSAGFLQAQKADRFSKPGKNTPQIRVDTVSTAILALPPGDTAIISYEILIVVPGHTDINKTVTNGIFPMEIRSMLIDMPPGSKIYYDNIRKRLPGGGTTRMQNRLYVIDPSVFR